MPPARCSRCDSGPEKRSATWPAGRPAVSRPPGCPAQGEAQFGTYALLVSMRSRRTYVGKFWSGPIKERLRKHFATVLDPTQKDGRWLYGGLRSAGIHNYFMLPLKTYAGKVDCDADEKLIIRRTHRPGETLNTCVHTKYPEGATINFVRQRTRVVRTAKQKISALFCNPNRVAVCVDEAECRCDDSLDRELPRRDGHVCFRTTELHGKYSDLNRSLKATPRQAAETADYLLSGTTDFLNQLNLFETVSVAAIRKLLPWKCNVDGSSYLLVENFTDEIFFVAVCGADGLVVQVTWHRFIWLLQRLDAFSTAHGRDKQSIFEHLLRVVNRLLAWYLLVTRDYWIMPYTVQDAIRFCFSLIDELFASPLDVNLDSAVFCTPYAEDVCFGAFFDNSYRILWHLCALGNPIYTVAHIRKCLDHALFSTICTTRKPARIRRADSTLLGEVGLSGGFCVLQKKKFRFLAPQSALGFVDRYD
ncbi:hypothetical protein CYMTET_7509 [Cymbomonas tetramitiformis]|uniref:Uncharacterized protein n=1 Tax=Cymbomonas tetramitiformis TaxID=36881 RepID=A0AAE0GWV1_9CHLO|nr:hypothetical protein CYMTET_7509 [Cymbomonas tetramitiformis]